MKASILSASAGSGKTYRLAYKYVRDVVEEPSIYRHILAVTFTNKATEEMKRRILQQIHTLASGGESPYMTDLMRDLGYSEELIRQRADEAQSLILHNYSHFTVLTIDKFFQRLLRAFIQELGVDIGYNLEIESSTIIEQSVDALIELSGRDETLHRWLLEYIEERVADGKRWDIREGILSISGELFREEARRTLLEPISKSDLKRMVAEREREAQREREELQRLGAQIMQAIGDAGLDASSFKGGTRSVAQVFRKIEQGEVPTLTDAQQGSIHSEQAWYGAKSPQGVKAMAPTMQRMMALVAERLTAAHLAINTAALLRENYRGFALLSDLNAVTQQICHEQNTMLLNQTSRFVEEFVKECDAPFIYEKVGNRFSRFMIDEFQDTSRREWNNFVPLLKSALSQSKPTEESVLIVGDVKQSIYRWRGGDWRILCSDATEQLGREQTEVVNMVDNYRSLREVVNFNNEMIDRVVQQVNISLGEQLSQAVSSGVIDQSVETELSDMLKVAYEGHRQNPKRSDDTSDGYVEVVTYEETPPIICRVCEAIDRGFKPCDIMILTRTNSQAASVAQMLLKFKREQSDDRYRFDVMTQQALVVGYAPVSQFIIAVLKLVVNSDDELQRALYNKFLSLDVDSPLSDDDLQFLREVRMFAPIEAFEMILKRYDLGSQQSDIAYVQAIHEQVIDFCCNRIGDISLFLKWWEQSGSSKSLNVERSERAIEILTLHKAKGLEKRVVIIPYCKWSMNPLSSGLQRSYVWAQGAQTPQLPIAYRSDMSVSAFAADYYRELVYSNIDSVNMLYVALTRAAESLHVLIPVTRKKSGERDSVGIGREMLRVLPMLPQSVKVVEQPQPLLEEDEVQRMNISYQFGEPSAPAKSEQTQLNPPYIMDRYDSHKAQLRLRMPSKRYREDGEYKPREIGIMMHKAFESARTIDDIDRNVELMLANAQISTSEHEELRGMVHRSLQDPLAQEWFTTAWDRVRNESDIIRPQSVGSSRPDRVMIDGQRCVVVDYKFGALHSGRYEKQMREYMALMQEMGYTQVEGYLWYLRQGEIRKVSLA